MVGPANEGASTFPQQTHKPCSSSSVNSDWVQGTGSPPAHPFPISYVEEVVLVDSCSGEGPSRPETLGLCSQDAVAVGAAECQASRWPWA